jgi:hypothetical protein
LYPIEAVAVSGVEDLGFLLKVRNILTKVDEPQFDGYVALP